MLMNICYFIISGVLLSTEEGDYRLATFSDEHMNRLFERFVLEYYRKHHKDIQANSEKLSWDIDDDKPVRGIEFLPSMQTDIVLRKDGKALIIDTKYYGEILKGKFDKKAISNANMYQIFSYVKNMDTGNTGNVSGMLLYAKTGEEMSEPVDTYINGNLTANSFTRNASTGDLIIKARVEAQTISVINSTGDVVCNSYITANTIKIKTSTGSVKLMLLGEKADYNYSYSISTGESNIPPMVNPSATKTVSVTCSTGDSNIYFEK